MARGRLHGMLLFFLAWREWRIQVVLHCVQVPDVRFWLHLRAWGRKVLRRMRGYRLSLWRKAISSWTDLVGYRLLIFSLGLTSAV